MIYSIDAIRYKNTLIYTMDDSGAIFYEIDTDTESLYFDTLEEAKAYLDTIKKN